MIISGYPDSNIEGPNENAMVELTNGSILCVMRLDATGAPVPYASSMSSDGGFSWSAPQPLADDIGAARPRLLRLGGAVLLSGGRRTELKHDALIWLNNAGDGVSWAAYSISFQHNALMPKEGLGNWSAAELSFSSHLNTTNSWPWECSSYTSLVRTGPTTAFITYNRYDDATGRGFDFTMPLKLETTQTAV